MCGIGSYKTDKGDEACTQCSDNDSQTTLANASISEASCGKYPVDAGLFFKSYFYIAGVYWKNIII